MYCETRASHLQVVPTLVDWLTKRRTVSASHWAQEAAGLCSSRTWLTHRLGIKASAEGLQAATCQALSRLIIQVESEIAFYSLLVEINYSYGASSHFQEPNLLTLLNSHTIVPSRASSGKILHLFLARTSEPDGIVVFWVLFSITISELLQETI